MAEVSQRDQENNKLKPLIKWPGGKTRLNSLLIEAVDVAIKALKVENKLLRALLWRRCSVF